MAQSSSKLGFPLPLYLANLAKNDPDRAFAKLVTTNASERGGRIVTVSELENAVDECARWMDKQFGTGREMRTLAFMAPAADIFYLILMLAAVKSGRLAFFPSPRNDIEAQCSLFKEYECKTLILPEKSPILHHMKPVVERMGLDVRELSGLEHFLSARPEPYGWSPPGGRDVRTEPLVALHTSGSTGIPKPLIMKHGNFTAMEHWTRVTDLGHDSVHFSHWKGKRILLGFPLFHTAAINLLMAAILNNIFVIFPPPTQGPLSAELVSDILQRTEVDILAGGPSILADMASSPKLLEPLGQVEYAAYGGGPLPMIAGDLIARHCHVLNIIGMSESGILPCELVDQDDWQYIKFSPVLGIEMRPYGDLYELVFVRDKRWEDFQVMFFTFPELQEWSSKDLFSPHPTKPGYWLWQGRRDDIVVYSNGEKFNPTSMEDTINGSPYVQAALVYGEGRPQSALLVELNDVLSEHPSVSKIVNEIWHVVQQANTTSPSHARILKDMVLLADPNRPLPRAGKGTVQRKAAFKLYAKELDALYERADQLQPPPQRNDSVQEVVDFDRGRLMKQILQTLHETSGLDINPDENFFFAGLDSLGVVALVRTLRKFLAAYGEQHQVDARMVYEHPSAYSLVNYLFGDDSDDEYDSEDVMQNLYTKYTPELPITAREPIPYDPNKKVVVLTGSTGTFGTYLLDRLLMDNSVAHIICLNRSEDAEQRQLEKLEAKGLATDLKGKTITFAMADFAKPYFGLDLKVYRALLDGVTHVVHNAWQVNFNLPVEHFETPHISGVRQLVDFSARSAHGAMLVFISSISSVSAYNSEPGSEPIPEAPIEDWSAASSDSGYGQSKLVAECILTTAAKEALIPSVVIRVGQIAGPTSGNAVWPKHEWLPSLVISSKFLGCLPASLGSFDTVDWIPVNIAAEVVSDFILDAEQKLRNSPGETLVYHAVNPKKTTWDNLLPTIQPYLSVSNVVPPEEWLEALVESEDKASNENPAAILLRFYRSIMNSSPQALFDTVESKKASKALKEMSPITGELFGKWLRKWV